MARLAPLLHRAMPFIAHPQIRNRGTMGGSLAHADPAAELPAVALALDARFLLRRRGGERWVGGARVLHRAVRHRARAGRDPGGDRDPVRRRSRTGWAFQEFSRRHGDFALAGVAAGVTLDGGRTMRRARAIALLGVGEGPILAERGRRDSRWRGGHRRRGRRGRARGRRAMRAADDLEPPVRHPRLFAGSGVTWRASWSSAHCALRRPTPASRFGSRPSRT